MSLENTTWTINGLGGDIRVDFKSNNVATTTHPNGQTFEQYWDENGGAFAIEAPNSTVNKEIFQVYTGSYSNAAGQGNLFSFGVAGPEKFTMTKQA